MVASLVERIEPISTALFRVYRVRPTKKSLQAVDHGLTKTDKDLSGPIRYVWTSIFAHISSKSTIIPSDPIIEPVLVVEPKARYSGAPYLTNVERRSRFRFLLAKREVHEGMG